MGGQIWVIVHLGLYSVPAYDDMKSVLKRRMYNGAEWYLRRLTEKGAFRPISGWKETQKYHEEHYPGMDYYEFAQEFIRTVRFFKEIMDIASKIGAIGVILTAKHHDGFTLWPSNHAHWKAHKDFVMEFRTEAHRHNLQFGIYYSWSEFNIGCTASYLDNIVEPQIRELLTYEPTHWFFDGDWDCKSKYAQEMMNDLVTMIKENNPDVMINDRIGHLTERADRNYLGLATYRTYGDRAISENKPAVPWMHVNTIGYSWGRNKEQQREHYKTGADLMDLYQRVSEKSGDFMINIGPNADGSVCDEERDSLLEFAALRS